jgi:hypothetical protein
MPVNSTNRQYQAMSDAWHKMRDVVAGEERVHYAGEAYLPRLGGQDADEYGAYVMRALFYNATQRTIDGLSGMIFRKEPQVEVPEAMRDWLDDVTLDGVSFSSFSESLVEEELIVSRAGVLVDFPRADGDVPTQAQAAAENRQPFLKMYQAETVIDWQHGMVQNKTQLMHVRLHETVDQPKQDDPFETDTVTQYRVLDLVTRDDEGNAVQPFYRQQVYQKIGTQWQVVDEVVPQMNGAPLPYIPFVFIGPRGTQWEVSKPLLLDLANVNLSHYRTVADLEHGAHFVALPTPYCFGVPEDEQPTAIGPTELWTAQSSDVTVGLLEFTGQGLEALEKRREVKEAQMAALGARMLAPEKRQAEAAETMAIRHSGEMSVLASLANAVSQGLTEALTIARDWLGLNGDVSVELNTDFMPVQMDPQKLTALMKAWQAGGIAFDDLIWNLQRGEIVREDRSADDIRADVQDEQPAMPEPQSAFLNAAE